MSTLVCGKRCFSVWGLRLAFALLLLLPTPALLAAPKAEHLPGVLGELKRADRLPPQALGVTEAPHRADPIGTAALRLNAQAATAARSATTVLPPQRLQTQLLAQYRRYWQQQEPLVACLLQLNDALAFLEADKPAQPTRSPLSLQRFSALMHQAQLLHQRAQAMGSSTPVAYTGGAWLGIFSGHEPSYRLGTLNGELNPLGEWEGYGGFNRWGAMAFTPVNAASAAPHYSTFLIEPSLAHLQAALVFWQGLRANGSTLHRAQAVTVEEEEALLRGYLRVARESLVALQQHYALFASTPQAGY